MNELDLTENTPIKSVKKEVSEKVLKKEKVWG